MQKEIAAPLELLALALPFVALATVMLLALRGGTRARAPTTDKTGMAKTPKWGEARKAAAPSQHQIPADAKPEPEIRAERAMSAAIAEAKAPSQPARSRVPDPASMLLDRIRAAVLSKEPLAHAEARVELGDLLQAAGDLTTACEHWQIARAIYADGGPAGALEGVERRMRANGCPTDWVLNDF